VLTADSSNATTGFNAASDALNDYSYATDSASIALMRKMDSIDAYNNVLQRSSGLIGQTLGNMQEFGYVTEEQYESFRKMQIGLELLLVPLEVYMMYQQFAQARTMATTGALYGQTAATTTATTSTWGFNVALYANPIGIVVLAIIVLVAALWALEKKFGTVTTVMAVLNEQMQLLAKLTRDAADGFDNLIDKAGILGDVFKWTPLGMQMELFGAVR